MLRLALAGLLTFAALTALAPNAAAVYVCGHQNDASDLTLGDDPVWRTHCTTENLDQVDLDCEATVTVDTDGVTYPARCDQLIPCDPCCGYCPPPVEATTAAAAPCATFGSPFLDAGFGVQCTAGPASCSAATATFGTVGQFLAPDAGCDVDVALCTLGPQVEDGKADRLLLQCDGMVQCVTEPCPWSDGIKL